MDEANTDINTSKQDFSGKRHIFTKEEKVRGGKSKSHRKAMANSIKNLKHGRYSRYFTKAAAEYIINPRASAELIYNMIEGVANSNLSERQRIELIKVMITAHQAVHGNKNINYNQTVEFRKYEEDLQQAREKIKEFYKNKVL